VTMHHNVAVETIGDESHLCPPPAERQAQHVMPVAQLPWTRGQRPRYGACVLGHPRRLAFTQELAA
jgi:hypothetical protein